MRQKWPKKKNMWFSTKIAIFDVLEEKNPWIHNNKTIKKNSWSLVFEHLMGVGNPKNSLFPVPNWIEKCYIKKGTSYKSQ